MKKEAGIGAGLPIPSASCFCHAGDALVRLAGAEAVTADACKPVHTKRDWPLPYVMPTALLAGKLH